MPEQLSLLKQGRQFALQDLDWSDSISKRLKKINSKMVFLIFVASCKTKTEKKVPADNCKQMSTHQNSTK